MPQSRAAGKASNCIHTFWSAAAITRRPWSIPEMWKKRFGNIAPPVRCCRGSLGCESSRASVFRRMVERTRLQLFLRRSKPFGKSNTSTRTTRRCCMPPLECATVPLRSWNAHWRKLPSHYAFWTSIPKSTPFVPTGVLQTCAGACSTPHRLRLGVRFNRQPFLLRTEKGLLVLRIRREDCQLRRKTAIIHFERRFDHVSDIFTDELRWVLPLRETRCRAETGEHFAGIDEKYANVVLAELRSPAFCHPTKSEFTGVVGRAIGRAAKARCRTDVHNVAFVSLDKMLRGFATHEHRASHISGKDPVKGVTIQVHEFFENSDTRIVNQNVQMTEGL